MCFQSMIVTVDSQLWWNTELTLEIIQQYDKYQGHYHIFSRKKSRKYSSSCYKWHYLKFKIAYSW